MPATSPTNAALGKARFDELAEVLGGAHGVVVGRRFGRACLKIGKRVFVVLDGECIAFRVGATAAGMLEALPGARLWNPRDQRAPKQSWIAHPAWDVPTLATIAVAALQWALARPGADASGGAPEFPSRGGE